MSEDQSCNSLSRRAAAGGTGPSRAAATMIHRVLDLMTQAPLHRCKGRSTEVKTAESLSGSTILFTTSDRGSSPAVRNLMAVSVDLEYPFEGRWQTQNSPANRVPSHGTTLFGTSYAIDFIPVMTGAHRADLVDDACASRTSRPVPRLRRPLLAPVEGTVVAAHDTEPDHESFRGLPSVVYALTQRRRAAAGGGARRKPCAHRGGRHCDCRVPSATGQRRGEPRSGRSAGRGDGALWKLGQQHRATCPRASGRQPRRRARQRRTHDLQAQRSAERRDRGRRATPVAVGRCLIG